MARQLGAILKKPSRNSIPIIILVAILVQGCQLGQGLLAADKLQEDSFGEITSARDVNETIELAMLEPLQHQQTSAEIVSLEIRNLGDRPVVFPGDFGVKGYRYDETSEQWRTVPNSVEYPSGEKLLGAQGDEIPSVSVVHFGTNEDNLRILVRGYFPDANGSRGEPVAAFTDVDITW